MLVKYLKIFSLLSMSSAAEIGGCFLFWYWFKLRKSIWFLVPSIILLVIFVYSLHLIESEYAGKIYALSASIYAIVAVMFMTMFENYSITKYDIVGLFSYLIGSLVIFLG